jgi:hypothetical protein
MMAAIVSAPNLLFVLAFAFVCYVLGATFVEGLVNYRSWRHVGQQEFKTYHRAIGPRVIAIVVVPFVTSVLLTVLLLWFRPQPIPLWSVWLSLGADVLAIIVSVAFQVPSQLKLDRGGLSLPTLERLIKMERIRNAAHSFNTVLFVWMMLRLTDNFH